MSEAIENQVQTIGRGLLEALPARPPALFNQAWWQGRLLDWAMRDEPFKLDLFRLVDVLPALRSPEEVVRHLNEYLGSRGASGPAWLRLGLGSLAAGGRLAQAAAHQVEQAVEAMAATFIAGESLAQAAQAVGALRERGLAASVDLLGEETLSEDEAASSLQRYLDLLDHLAAASAAWSPAALLDADHLGSLPRASISVKPSSLSSQLDPMALEHSVEVLSERLRSVFVAARERGLGVTVDMEHHQLKDLTIAAFERALEQPGLHDYHQAGIALQAYLTSAEDDVARVIAWAQRAGRPVGVRLVKGAYWDFEVLHARQRGWTVPVYLDKASTDTSFERCTARLLQAHAHIRTAIGSHNVRSIAVAMAWAESLALAREALEVQMLYGMAEPLKEAIAERGYRLRDYVPIGAMLPGMAYLVRRLLENTANEGFLRARTLDRADAATLLAPPRPQPPPPPPPPEFSSEPLADSTDPARRAGLAGAIERQRAALGADWPLLLNGRPVETGRWIVSTNPAAPDELIGRAAAADPRAADQAIEAARLAAPAWAALPAGARAERLRAIAAALRRQRDDLAALLVLEVGKSWREADAELAEAVDYAEFYAAESLRLLAAPPRLGRYPGELNHLIYEPLGVGVVIAPWNFPLAIPLGMSLAAIAAGNAVVLKPAETASGVAAAAVRLCHAAGLSPGLLNYLPGYGEEVGAYLVSHPQVRFVAFTGSREVGLQILRQAHDTSLAQNGVRRVVCEMGGKNAIVVDSDADLDVAVRSVVESAFGYQGQKCSACSRAVVLSDCYERFVERLIGATASLRFGPPEDPSNTVGPLIDQDALKRVREYLELGRQEARLLYCREPEQPAGFYPPIAIFGEVEPHHRLAREEIFGPVLALQRARDFGEALRLAQTPGYALTGGVISRSPSHLEQARREFRVGNLYLNRGITGALVGRQPFGGLGFSGIGNKAGGPNYLLQFTEERVISENTVRRGFAPPP